MDVPAPRRSRVLRILAWQSVFVLGALAVSEIVVRVHGSWTGHPHSAADVREHLALVRSRATELVPSPVDANADLPAQFAEQAQLLHPYLGSIVSGKRQQIDVEMVRVDQPKHDSDFEILILGGSVAAMFGPFGTPRMLEILRADPRLAEREIYVYQYGVGGYKQPQSLNLAEYLFALGFTPECVILIDGFNEAALGNSNAVQGSNPVFPSYDHWNKLAYVSTPDRESVGLAWRGLELQRQIVDWVENSRRFGVPYSALASTLVWRRLDGLERDARAAFDAYSQVVATRGRRDVLAGPPYPQGLDEAARLSVRCWEQGSRSLRAACEARGATYLHFLQPTLHDTGSKPLTPREVREGAAPQAWIDGVQAAYPKMREVGARLRAEGERFVDLSMLFVDVRERIYFDNCHYLEPGNRRMAERIGTAILESLRNTK